MDSLRVTLSFVIGIILGIFLGMFSYGMSHRSPTGVEALAKGDIATCFVPRQNCTEFIVEAINLLAKEEILVQAYGFTSPPILKALSDAKARGVKVRVILDRSNEQQRYTGGTYVQCKGVEVHTDNVSKIAHNKVMIFDRKHTLTGSFNFTVSAQRGNAENVVVIKERIDIASSYLENWNERVQKSRPFKNSSATCRSLEEDDE